VGATVTLTALRYGCCVGHALFGPNTRTPAFVGDTVGQALREIARLAVPWQMTVLGFRHERRPLFATARVTAQMPAAGVSLNQRGGTHIATMTAAYPR
jgi:hypothetical protein